MAMIIGYIKYIWLTELEKPTVFYKIKFFFIHLILDKIVIII